MNTVCVLGTVNRDLLEDPAADCPLLEAPGGVLYTLLALRRLLPELHPRAAVLCGEDLRPALEELLPPAWLAEIRWREEATNTVHLDCSHPEDKVERARLSLPSYRLTELPSLQGLDGLLLNCTSGMEFGLRDWRALLDRLSKESPDCHTQLDLHSLSLEPVSGPPRRLRILPDALDWARGLGLLQLTLAESFSLDGRRRNRLAEADDLLPRLEEVGLRRLLLSNGAEGFRFVDFGAGLDHVAVAEAGKVIDTTGCGDVLGAAFFAGLLEGRDALSLCRGAARAAASALHGRGPDKLAALPGLALLCDMEDCS